MTLLQMATFQWATFQRTIFQRVTIERIALGTVAVFAFALRVYRIGYRELWFDEIGQAMAGRGDIGLALSRAASHSGATPLDYVITWGMLHLGNGDAILRLPAALFGAAAVALIAVLGRIWFGRLTGLIAALLFAITPQHVRYSQELRFYSLAVCMSLACVGVFWWAQQGRSRWRWMAWCAVLTVGLYSHYYLAFVALGCGLWALIWRRDVLWQTIAAGSVAAVLFMPWVYYDNVAHGDGGLVFSIEQLLTHIPLRRLLLSPFGNQVPWQAWTLWGLVGLALLSLPWQPQRRSLALVILVGLSALGGAWVLDGLGGYPFYVRQALVALPWLMLAAIAGLLGMVQRINRSAAVVVACILVVGAGMVFIPDLRAFYPHDYSDRGLVAASRYLSHHLGADDAVVVGGDHARFPWYAPNLNNFIVPITWRRFDQSLHTTADEHGRLWIVAWRANAARRVTAWAEDNQAWNVTPWPNGETVIYVYSATDPDAGLEVGKVAIHSPALPSAQRTVLRRLLVKQLEQRGREDEAERLSPNPR